MATNQRMALKKLQRAINARSESKILVSETEWYSDKRNATITSYIIRKALPTKDTSRGRKKHTELFNKFLNKITNLRNPKMKLKTIFQVSCKPKCRLIYFDNLIFVKKFF